MGQLQDCAASIFTTADDDADVVPPDTEFRYGGAQWQVAGAVAEAASGRSWAELIEETYVQPCGLEPGCLGHNNPISQMGNGIDSPIEFGGDPSSPLKNPNLESGAYATPAVFARLLLMYLRGGEQQVLSEQAIELAVADRVATVYGGDAVQPLGRHRGRFGVWDGLVGAAIETAVLPPAIESSSCARTGSFWGPKTGDKRREVLSSHWVGYG